MFNQNEILSGTHMEDTREQSQNLSAGRSSHSGSAFSDGSHQVTFQNHQHVSPPDRQGLFSQAGGNGSVTNFSQQNPAENHHNDENARVALPVFCGFEEEELLSEQYKKQRVIPPQPFKVLDAPCLQDDFYLNLVDWSAQNVLAVGLGSCIYLWSAQNSKVTKLSDIGPNNRVTSV